MHQYHILKFTDQANLQQRDKTIILAISIAVLTIITSSTVIIFLREKPAPIDADNISFLALGDSYTIGEAVPQNDSWPFQLRDQALENDLNITKMDIIAKSGWTSHDLLENVSSTHFDTQYDIVALMIGVNDQFNGVSPEVYESNFTELLNFAATLTYEPQNVIVISIPDYSLSPAICSCAKVIIQQEIDALNQKNLQTSIQAGTRYVDVTRITRYEGLDPSMYADDDLHFSGKMYGLWVDEITNTIDNMVNIS